MSEAEKIATSNNCNETMFRGVGEAVMGAIRASGESYHTVIMRYIDQATVSEDFHDWLKSHYRTDFIGVTVSSEVQVLFIPDTVEEIMGMLEGVPASEGVASDEDLGLQPAYIRVTRTEF